MRKVKVLFSLLAVSAISQADVGDLLISEVAVTPTAGEFIEIYNNGGSTIDLSNVYLTDATFANGSVYYYKIVTGVDFGGGDFEDFHSRFPAGAMIGPGEYQTISTTGSSNFNSTYGVNPTYELYEDGGSPDAVPDMREAVAGSINDQGSLTNSGEMVMLYNWDGSSDLVQDLDYVVWGDKVEAIDKTGVSIDGPDGDSTASSYQADTSIAAQIVIGTGAHSSGQTWQRIDYLEGCEINSGGNGFNGHNEMSENSNETFEVAGPTPNAASQGAQPPICTPDILINEVDALTTGNSEFVELFGDANASLDDVKLVFFDGSTDQAYMVIDLNGESLDSSGYYLVGNSSLTPDTEIDDGSLEDGADAVALYFTSSTISVGDAVSTTDLLDAFVYDTDDADDAGLLALLNASQSQVDEDSNGMASTESSARCSNGSGGARNTLTYKQSPPTPGLVNNMCPVGDYYELVDTTNATTLRNTLHETIDDHTVFPYSGGMPDACDILEEADEDPNNSSNVWMLYSNESLPDVDSCGGAYNREHTWPNSRFTGDTGSTVGSDTHHLMATDKDYNSRRGSAYFDNCDVGCSNVDLTTFAHNGVGGSGSDGDSNWRDNTGNPDVFEVWDFRKGDVARAMFYMDVRYEGDSGEPDLILTDNTTTLLNRDINYMGKLTTLCEWHFADPVDDIERSRNEVIFTYQQNRNPFIDHPEWVSLLFSECAAVNPNDLIFENGFE